MYEAKALYTSEREHLAQEILKEIAAVTAPRGITVETTPLRRVTLPQLAGLGISCRCIEYRPVRSPLASERSLGQLLPPHQT